MYISSSLSAESKMALYHAMKGNSDISASESEYNLNKNLLLIYQINVYNHNYSNIGNGLKVTTNGFIITTNHLLIEYVNYWRKINNCNDNFLAVDKDGNKYELDRNFYIAEPNYDIAILKAIIPEKPKPIPFRIINRSLKEDDKVYLEALKFAIPTPILDKRNGSVTSANHNAIGHKYIALDTFLTNIKSTMGYSGGIIRNIEGDLAGLLLYSCDDGNESGYAKISNIDNLAQRVYTS